MLYKKTSYQFSLQLNDANFKLTKKSFERIFFTENGNIHRIKMSDTHCIEANDESTYVFLALIKHCVSFVYWRTTKEIKFYFFLVVKESSVGVFSSEHLEIS